jgi:Mg2+ and Co2+ transporter CorA
MGKVAKLPAAANDAPATETADEMLPAFEIAVSANFADLQQVMLRMPIKEPIGRAEANRLTDLLVDIGQRQVARQEIRVNEAALKDKRRALELQQRRHVEESEKHAAELKAVEDEIVRLMAKREQLDQEGAAQWIKTGRTGDYRAEGHRKNQLARLQQDIDAQREKAKTLAAEHAQKVEKAQNDIIERLTEEIAAIERVIAKNREIVG